MRERNFIAFSCFVVAELIIIHIGTLLHSSELYDESSVAFHVAYFATLATGFIVEHIAKKRGL